MQDLINYTFLYIYVFISMNKIFKARFHDYSSTDILNSFDLIFIIAESMV